MAGQGRSPRSEEAPPDRLLGVVLAGGRSSRMGRDKASLPHPHGGTLLEHAAAAMKNAGCHVIISGKPTLPGLTSLPDPVADGGPAVGVATAVQVAEQANRGAALIVPVDMPAIAAPHLQCLIAAWQQQPQRLVAATFDGDFLEPLLAIYPVGCLASLQALTRSPHRSLSRWLSQQECCPVRLPAEVRVNLNTAAEWDRYCKSSASSGNSHRPSRPE